MAGERAAAYVVGTFDTKRDELHYVAGLIREAGLRVVTVDVGTRSDERGVDVPARELARSHPDGPGGGSRGRGSRRCGHGHDRGASALDPRPYGCRRHDRPRRLRRHRHPRADDARPSDWRPEGAGLDTRGRRHVALCRHPRHHDDVPSHRRRRAEPHLARGPRQCRERACRHDAAPSAAYRRRQALDRHQHVRGHDALRARRERGAVGGVRCPGLPCQWTWRTRARSAGRGGDAERRRGRLDDRGGRLSLRRGVQRRTRAFRRHRQDGSALGRAPSARSTW